VVEGKPVIGFVIDFDLGTKSGWDFQLWEKMQGRGGVEC
jgi:hypothetical protein